MSSIDLAVGPPTPRPWVAEPALPTVSVIIPTYNRAPVLADTLAGLMAQDYQPDQLEIIVVDNSSSDNTEAVVAAAAARSPFIMRYFRKENRGPAASRNYGATRATGEILGFVDSDCHVRPDWARAGVARLRAGVGLVAGPIRPFTNPDRVPSFFIHQIPEFNTEHPLYPTANIFYRRSVFEKLGGFDEQFGAYRWGTPIGGEDTDLAWRVKRAGWDSDFAEGAVVYHEATHLPAAKWLIDPVKIQILPLLVARIPELRSCLWVRYFADRHDPPFYLAVVGVISAITRRDVRRLALVLPWVWMMRGVVRRDVWPPSRWWRIPIKYALTAEQFAVQSGALIYASVRYRALVL